MIKTEQLNNLFLKWKEFKPVHRTSFSEDGIINEELWNGAKRKIVFLFKERNHGKGDFRELLNKDKNPWPIVGYWSYGLQNVTSSFLPDFTEAGKNKKDSCRSAAIVNFKKAPGEGSSNMEKIQEVASSDREFIEKELRIISPEIIVCGGVFNICAQMWGKYERISERVHKTAIFKDIAWIDFAHPAARIGPDVLYYSLLYFFQKYLNSRNR